MIEYRVISNDCPRSLDHSVNEAIKDGWRPIGGVSTAVRKAGWQQYCKMYQAMTRDCDAVELTFMDIDNDDK